MDNKNIAQEMTNILSSSTSLMNKIKNLEGFNLSAEQKKEAKKLFKKNGMHQKIAEAEAKLKENRELINKMSNG